MKSLLATFIALAVAIVLIVYILSATRNTTSDQIAGVDQSKSSSSYEQKTNHFPMPSYDLGPIQGSESPYKVNQWMSYQV